MVSDFRRQPRPWIEQRIAILLRQQRGFATRRVLRIRASLALWLKPDVCFKGGYGDDAFDGGMPEHEVELNAPAIGKYLRLCRDGFHLKVR